MDLTVLVSIILGLMLACAVGFLLYSGLLNAIEIRISRPPVGDLKVFYKFRTGPYKECCSVFAELETLAPKLDKFGIYYDDPKVVESSKLRYAVGVVLPDDLGASTNLKDQLLVAKFKSFNFPSVERAINVKFPLKNRLSIFIAIHTVYPRLSKFMEKNKLNVKAVMEYYRKDCMYFYIPLDNMENFLVSEALQD